MPDARKARRRNYPERSHARCDPTMNPIRCRGAARRLQQLALAKYEPPHQICVHPWFKSPSGRFLGCRTREPPRPIRQRAAQCPVGPNPRPSGFPPIPTSDNRQRKRPRSPRRAAPRSGHPRSISRTVPGCSGHPGQPSAPEQPLPGPPTAAPGGPGCPPKRTAPLPKGGLIVPGAGRAIPAGHGAFPENPKRRPTVPCALFARPGWYLRICRLFPKGFIGLAFAPSLSTCPYPSPPAAATDPILAPRPSSGFFSYTNGSAVASW